MLFNYICIAKNRRNANLHKSYLWCCQLFYFHWNYFNVALALFPYQSSSWIDKVATSLRHQSCRRVLSQLSLPFHFRAREMLSILGTRYFFSLTESPKALTSANWRFKTWLLIRSARSKDLTCTARNYLAFGFASSPRARRFASEKASEFQGRTHSNCTT